MRAFLYLEFMWWMEYGIASIRGGKNIGMISFNYGLISKNLGCGKCLYFN